MEKLRKYLETGYKRGEFSRTALVNGILKTALQYLDEAEKEHTAVVDSSISIMTAYTTVTKELLDMKAQVKEYFTTQDAMLQMNSKEYFTIQDAMLQMNSTDEAVESYTKAEQALRKAVE